MIESKLINNHYGAGNYLLINCSEGVKFFLDREGYLTSTVSCDSATDIDWNKLSSKYLPFDFVLVDKISRIESIDLSLLLENIVLISESRVKIVLSFNIEATEHSRNTILEKIEEHGFHEDYSLSCYCINSEQENFQLNIAAIFGAHHGFDSNREISVKERNFCEIAKNYVRQNETVALIGLNELIADVIFNQQTTVSVCSIFSDIHSFVKGYSEKIIPYLASNDLTPALQYDCIVIYSEYDYRDNILYTKILESLTPGGRLIYVHSSLMNNHLDPEYFDIEAMYGGTKKFIGWKEIATGSLSLYNFPAREYDFYIVCAMKNPFIDRDKFKYIETSYNYSHPPRNLLAFERDYINPWIVKSMVEFPFRNRLPSTLKKYAEYILANFGSLSADYGAALAILGYQCFDNPANDYERSVMDKIVTYCNGIVAAKNPNAHQARWFISLSVLGGEINKKNGDFTSALNLYIRAVSIDFNRFSPTIGTKILQAYYNIAIMLFSKKEYVKSEAFLKKGILKGYELLSVPHEEIYGNIEKPLQFTLYIYHDILDWLIKLTNAKNYLRNKAGLLASINNMTWSSVISERLNAINEMDLMIKHRDGVIKSQALMIDESTEINTKMNILIEERGEEIKSQASIIDEHLESINKFKLILKEKSEVEKSQSEMIDARWKAMTEMEKMIEERDEYIRNLEEKNNTHN